MRQSVKIPLPDPFISAEMGIVRVSEKILTSENSFVIRNTVPYYGTISTPLWSVIVHTIESVNP